MIKTVQSTGYRVRSKRQLKNENTDARCQIPDARKMKIDCHFKKQLKIRNVKLKI